MDRQYTNQIILLSAVGTDGASTAQNFESFRNVELQIAMVGYTGTIKVAGSNADTAPNFGAAATAANPWDFIKCINQIDGSSVAGGTGISGSASTTITQLECNTNGFKWISVILSSSSAGTVTVKAKGYSNL